MRRASLLTIVGYSFGTIEAQQIHNSFSDLMHRLGYEETEINSVMSQITSINIGSINALEKGAVRFSEITLIDIEDQVSAERSLRQTPDKRWTVNANLSAFLSDNPPGPEYGDINIVPIGNALNRILITARHVDDEKLRIVHGEDPHGIHLTPLKQPTDLKDHHDFHIYGFLGLGKNGLLFPATFAVAVMNSVDCAIHNAHKTANDFRKKPAPVDLLNPLNIDPGSVFFLLPARGEHAAKAFPQDSLLQALPPVIRWLAGIGYIERLAHVVTGMTNTWPDTSDYRSVNTNVRADTIPPPNVGADKGSDLDDLQR